MKKIWYGILVMLLVCSVLGASGKSESGKADQSQTYTLRISTVIGSADPLFKGFKSFAEAVGKRTNGKVQASVYPDAQLGQDEDVMEQALLGTDVAFNTDAGRLGVRIKEMGIVLAPYLFDTPADARKFLVSDLFKKWQQRLEAEHNLTLLSLNYYVGGRNFITKTPIKSPDDLKGKRIRTPGAPVWQETIRSFGATPVALPWVETYPAFQQGVIDGAEAQHPATYGAKLHEGGKYITLTNHILLMNGLVVGTKWFKKLPEDYQKVLVEECIKAGDLTTEMVVASEKDYEKKMQAEGAKVNSIDTAPFKAMAENAYVKLGFVDLRKEISKILGK